MVVVTFSLLGPLEARIDGGPMPLGGARQRSLLAVLLLHANEPVSRERLIEAVWGAERPNTIGAALNVHLSKIRKLLAAVGVEATLVTERHGYALRVDSERLDLHCFEKSIREGRGALAAGRVEEAAAALDRALALWRGPPPRTSSSAPPSTVPSPASASCASPPSRIDSRRVSSSAGTRELVPEIEELVREHRSASAPEDS